MLVFEWVLALLVVAVVLTTIARRLRVPYPSLLALAGAALAFVPDTPVFRLDPELTLALFVAPVLLDAAYDTSVRDLKRNWIPVTCLVLAAVVVTTLVVAWVARMLVPEMPWAAAIALGAIVAPPDAAAATAVLRQLRLPHRMLVVLEGESLLNDAGALLIYRLAVLAVASGGLDLGQVAPAFALAVIGSIVVGYLLARGYAQILMRVEDVSSSIVLQFAGTFGVWILAERVGLSAIVTVVVFAMTIARDSPGQIPARQRVPSYAVWETTVFVLNVLAFVLIGLQLRPILGALEPAQRVEYFQVGAAVLCAVVVTRFAWTFLYYAAVTFKVRLFGAGRWLGQAVPTAKGSLIVGWCGMRGIVTLAAAYALPSASADSVGFPSRDLILLCAFFVVVGTLVIQGFTLRPLILALKLQDDGQVEAEVKRANEHIARVAMRVLDAEQSKEAKTLRREFALLLDGAATADETPNNQSPYDALRARIVAEQRRALLELRATGAIGDDAFHQLEARLDWAEMNLNGG